VEVAWAGTTDPVRGRVKRARAADTLRQADARRWGDAILFDPKDDLLKQVYRERGRRAGTPAGALPRSPLEPRRCPTGAVIDVA
jgi:hypothetical protein